MTSRKKKRDFLKENYVDLVSSGWNIYISAKNRKKIPPQRSE